MSKAWRHPETLPVEITAEFAQESMRDWALSTIAAVPLDKLFSTPLTVMDVLQTRDGAWAQVSDSDRLDLVLGKQCIGSGVLRRFAVELATVVSAFAEERDTAVRDLIRELLQDSASLLTDGLLSGHELLQLPQHLRDVLMHDADRTVATPADIRLASARRVVTSATYGSPRMAARSASRRARAFCRLCEEHGLAEGDLMRLPTALRQIGALQHLLQRATEEAVIPE